MGASAFDGLGQVGLQLCHRRDLCIQFGLRSKRNGVPPSKQVISRATGRVVQCVGPLLVLSGSLPTSSYCTRESQFVPNDSALTLFTIARFQFPPTCATIRASC